MDVLWTSHLKTKEEKEEFAKYVANSSSLLDRLGEIVRIKKESAEKARLDKEAYSSPSWAFIQADTNGYLRAIREIEHLLKR